MTRRSAARGTAPVPPAAPVQPAAPAPPPSPEEARSTDLRMARLHLRTGSLMLARAEFEALVAEGPLESAWLVDLAEIRWRTGDLAGAGDAAAAHMELGGIEARAIAIAAEAAAAIGRTGEAERLAVRASDLLGGQIDALFAGIPMSPIWPTMTPTADDASDLREPSSAALEPAETTSPPGPDPVAELDAARSDLALGDVVTAANRLAILLRMEPSTAPVVLDLLGDRSGPSLDLVRGDAYRIVGHEGAAQAAYAKAWAGVASGDAPRDGPDAGSVR